MKSFKAVKIMFYSSFILLGAILITLMGTTFAFFTASRHSDNNTLTAGNVTIVLSEAAVKAGPTGNLVEDPQMPRIIGGTDTTFHDYGKVYPGQTIFKDPTVTNTGSLPAWIAFKVTLTDGAGDLTQVMGYEGYEDIDIEVLLTGGLLDEKVHFGIWNGIPDATYNDHYVMLQTADATKGTFEFFFLILAPMEPEQSVTAFDHILFPTEWNNAEMQHLADLTICVEAFGVQATQTDNCLSAMTEAFPKHFPIHKLNPTP